MKGVSTAKSAGGSLKARWPFSPIPTKAASIGTAAMARFSRSSSAVMFGASPSTKQTVPMETWLVSRSRRYRRKLAGCSAERPMYSSRWNIVVRSHAMPRAATRCFRKLNWEAPVAATKAARPWRCRASRRICAAASAAALAITSGSRWAAIFIVSPCRRSGFERSIGPPPGHPGHFAVRLARLDVFSPVVFPLAPRQG